ncbi:MAG TPA: porin [Paraburkholderia sp.]|nr:porin [Paraburkholderia sp.]
MLAGLCSQSVHAQASVTLYGLIDTSVEITNPGSSWTTRMDSGAYRGSRIGLRGSEPITSDTSIIFALENGFNSANGAFSSPGTIFNRQAWIGLNAPWGQLRVGQQYSPIYIPFKGQLDAFGAGTIASGFNNLSKITPYVSNAITWISPDFHGLTSTITLTLRDGTSANGLAGNIETFVYRSGALKLMYAHQQTNDAGALRANMGGASYRFGKTTAYLSFFNGDGGTPVYHNDGASLSVRYALNSRLFASLGYTYMRDRSGGDNDADQLGAMCEYDLSRQLLFYASAGFLRNKGESEETLRGVNTVGLPPAYPGAPVRGVQFGAIERF